jgi:ABC-type transport system involved in cytochrome c biogenesis permease subunit
LAFYQEQFGQTKLGVLIELGPKETWALITWFVFAIYLHTRISKGWTGQRSAFIASFGFIIIWICYLGVNLLGKGLHSYGFFS